MLILFLSDERYKPYVICTIHSIHILYEICNKVIKTISDRFAHCIKDINMNQVDQNEILKQIDVYRLKMDINKYLIKIMNENLMDKLMKRTMRNIVNCWIISDSEYFNFVDRK